ncbi:MAG: peptidylprolyl isomerase [Bacteroidales bacterium]|jgi:peptidyl-prolyl cis-trans isomerase SurA|nr:peptidylprolyl isomerase [Bacteroidales bacterium]
MLKKILVILIIVLGSLSARSQSVIDQIVAVVGSEIILRSDIENQYIQYISQGNYSDEGDLKCEILEDLLFQKLLLLQAKADSLEVTEKEISQELNRRLNIFITQLGSEKKLEEFYGKSILEIKSDFSRIIQEQLLTQKAQAAVTSNVKITPSEVRAYYEAIPPDSLPVIEPYFELSEIVITPVITKEEKDGTIKKLNDIRDRILNGESFSTMAVLYSEDPGSAANGGELGFVSRTDLVPEFASVGFALTNTSDISRVIETEFGFHIIQLIEKRGNMMNFRHILMVPKTSIDQVQIAEQKADSIYNLLVSDSISFLDAVKKYSDSDTKLNEGKVTNPYYGTSKLTNDFVDSYTRRAISGLKAGEVSRPFLGSDNRGGKAMKILRVDTKVDKHTANLKDDYQEIQQYALQNENQKAIKKWISGKLNTTYIKIDESYRNCDFKYADWNKENKL